MATYTVSTTAQLLSALRSARSGDVVQLEAGTYSAVHIRGLNLSNVTIQSKNPDQPAVFTDLVIRDSSGLTVRNVEFSFPEGSSPFPFQVLRSADIRIDQVHVHGSLDGNPGNDSLTGLQIRWSRNVSVTNSEFEQLEHGLAHLDNQGLNFTGNSFHDIRTDGIRGGGSSDVLIARNTFTDFYPAEGDHPDAIQFWTGNTTESARNITVTGNEITRGEGGIVQGVFFRDQVTTLPYENVTITNNLVVGGMWNGISVNGVNNLTITDNTVVAFPDMNSYIRVDNGTNVWVENNDALRYLYNSVSRLYQSGNSTNERATDRGAEAVRQWHQEQAATPDSISKSMKPSVFLTPQESAPEGVAEAGSGQESLFEEQFVFHAGLDHRWLEIERFSRDVFNGGDAPAHHGLRPHVEALRFAVGSRDEDSVDLPGLLPSFEDLTVDAGGANFGPAGSTVFGNPVLQAFARGADQVDGAAIHVPFQPFHHTAWAAEFVV